MVIRTEHSVLELDLENGGRVQGLELSSPKGKKKVIWADSSLDFFYSGSFLMFPWVNRLESDEFFLNDNRIKIQPVLRDNDGHPIHGLYFQKERQIVSRKESDDSSEVVIEPVSIESSFPSFREKFHLEPDRLSVDLEVYNTGEKELFFSAGYHPYIGLGGSSIDSLEIISNCTDSVVLGEDLLPESPVKKLPISSIIPSGKIGALELDHCFTGNPSGLYFGILDRETDQKVILEIHRSFNLSVFFQIFTPSHRKSIAIEPMSSLGNAFSQKNGTHSSIKKNEVKVFSFSVRLE